MTKATAAPCKVWIGTSGYSFDDWHGPFYPPGTAPGRMLPFYAGQFDTVELNYSYYRLPVARTSAGMVRKTPAGFKFFVKANQAFTHGRNISEAEKFLAGIAPLKEADRLAGLLFQFPQSFKNTPANREYLLQATGEFQDYALAIEFRDCSWAVDSTYSLLEDNGLSLVAVDEPKLSTLFPRIAVATSDLGYVRFHSRNAANWYSSGVRGAERYDYLYNDEELREWLPLLNTIAQRSRNLFIYFNNCHRGQAAQNARAMKKLIEESDLAVEEPEVERGVTGITDGLWDNPDSA